MCDPVSLGIAATVLATTATVFTGYQEAQQHKYQAQVAEVNATYADRARVDAVDRGQRAQFDHYVQVSRLRGQQMAGLAASGVDTSMGSALDLQTDTALYASRDAETLAMNSAREAEGFTIEAQNYRSEAAGQRAAAKAGYISTALSAGSTILGGASQVAGGIDKYGKPGWWPKGGKSGTAGITLSGGGVAQYGG